MREELSDGVVRLRQWRAQDAPRHAEAVRESAAEVARFLPWARPDYSTEDAAMWLAQCREMWQAGSACEFAIEEIATGDLCGGCGVNCIDRDARRANLGYWMRTSKTRRGICTAAARLAARFAFEDLGIQRLEIVAAVTNIPSQRVAEKAGARHEGILRNRLILHGRPVDAVMFSLIPEDVASWR